MKRTAYAALACLTLALATYLVYRSGSVPAVHHGPVLGPHYVPRLPRPYVPRMPHHVPVMHRYVVGPGDCLWSIGQRLHVPWRTLAVADHIRTPYLIHPGQVLTWR